MTNVGLYLQAIVFLLVQRSLIYFMMRKHALMPLCKKVYRKRIVSKQAMIVNAGGIPVAYFANERKAIHKCKAEVIRKVVLSEERQRTLN